MKINVAEDHIKKGRHKSSTRCPVARAIREQLPAAQYVSVSDVAILMSRNKLSHLHICRAPDSVTQFVRAFDRHEDVAPFDFELQVEGL